MNFLINYFRRIKTIQISEGGAGLVLKITQRILQRPQILRAYVLAREIKRLPEHPQSLDDVEVSMLTESDENAIDAVAAFDFYGHSRADILTFLSEGQQCWIAKYKGQVVTCLWIRRWGFYDPYIKCHLELGENEEYLMGAFTHKEFRGKNILPVLHYKSLLFRLSTNPNLREYAWVRINNAASLSSCRKGGFVKVGNIGFVEILGLRLNYLIGRDAFCQTKKRIFIQLFP